MNMIVEAKWLVYVNSCIPSGMDECLALSKEEYKVLYINMK